MVFLYSSKLIFISWQPVQKASVLVAFSTVLNPPQKIAPAIKPPPNRVNSEKRVLGRQKNWQSFLNFPVATGSDMPLFLVEMNGAGARTAAPCAKLFRSPKRGYCWLP